MGKITFQATNNSYDILSLNSNPPAGLAPSMNFMGVSPVNANIAFLNQHACNITAPGNFILAGGNLGNPNNHPELFISGVTNVEVSNKADIKLKNYDPAMTITVDSGSILFSDHYLPVAGGAALHNITLTNGGKFTLNVNSAAGSLANIGQVTMASNTMLEFNTPDHHYSITSPRDNFVLNDLTNMAKIAEFIDSKFNNDIAKPEVKNNELQGLRQYANYQNKDLLKEFIAMTFGTNSKLVDNFINDNAFHINGICTDSSTSALGELPEGILNQINFYAGI